MADDRVTSAARRAPDRAPAARRAGLARAIELRGLGILPAPAVAEASLDLVIDLVAVDALERLPKPATIELLGVVLPLLGLSAREPSAAAKVRLAVRAGPRAIIPPP